MREKSRMWLPPIPKEEVVCMIEIILVHIIKLLFLALCAETIITFALIIALAKILSK